MPGASVKWRCLQQHLTRRLHKEAGCLCFVLDVGASVGHMLAESIDQVGSSSATLQNLDLLAELLLLQMAVRGSWLHVRLWASFVVSVSQPPFQVDGVLQNGETISFAERFHSFCPDCSNAVALPEASERVAAARACKRYTRPSRKTLQRVSRSSLYDPG